jgi:hypothetical protein
MVPIFIVTFATHALGIHSLVQMGTCCGKFLTPVVIITGFAHASRIERSSGVLAMYNCVNFSVLAGFLKGLPSLLLERFFTFVVIQFV